MHLTSSGSYRAIDNMLSSQARTSCTSQGFIALAPWYGDFNKYEYSAVNLGNNPNSKLEVVSSLNLFNQSSHLYSYDHGTRAEKYNPKVYMSTVQTTSINWIYDANRGLKSDQKSGSCLK
ncbi:MAG TPA: hypothetical protein DCY93_01250 [Firmicutes bacterium]|nr:hypothetical protein [Bacillota bacterium]